jgi:outer membrane protein, multidrug efflux system
MKRTVLLFALATAACAGPRPVQPQSASVTPPSGWREAAAIPKADIDPEWWKGFGDSVLSSLVARALSNNTDLAIAATRVEQARARFKGAAGQRLPSIGLDIAGGRERYVNPFGDDVDAWAGQAELGISYDVDLFGRLKATTGSARAALLASEHAKDSVRLAIAAATAVGYIQLRALDARLAVLRDTLADREDALRLAKRRTGAGYSTALELQQAQAQRDDAEQLIPATQLAIRQQEDGLSFILGEAPSEIPRGGGLDTLTLPGVHPSLPAELLRRRPDIAAAEQQIVAADRSLDAARSAFLPSVQLNVAGGYAASSLLLDNPLSIFSLGGSILQPLFEGGRLRAQERGAAAVRDEAAFAYRATALRAFQEVEDSLAAVDKTQAQERVLLREQQATTTLLTLASKRYREGYSPYLEQVDAQRTLLGTDLAVLQLRAQRLIAAVSLYQALGGGWTEARSTETSPKTADPQHN